MPVGRNEEFISLIGLAVWCTVKVMMSQLDYLSK